VGQLWVVVVKISLFSITSAGKFAVLHSFCSANYCDDGGVGGFMVSHGGIFYGTLGTGGAHGFDGMFSATSAGDFKLLYSFCSEVGCADGENLTSPPFDWLLVAPNGTLYGTAPSGGKYEANGTLFRLIP
jgi:hypothetical protein